MFVFFTKKKQRKIVKEFPLGLLDLSKVYPSYSTLQYFGDLDGMRDFKSVSLVKEIQLWNRESSESFPLLQWTLPVIDIVLYQ